ncbi:hypothetical protein JR316_0000951 [Psilocybe cubensis]|uniref:Uncharacterized protein n=1 Tax=Psilocybe cubensis TaxID=181762 RepID=A0ACB8HGC0_PSICU|nr:hypothetical protein JR316_0000951 [Psilocybe cubensis]KAH9486886.1 hypothetical protein JR316_0000951 [Psilocybe cubensis]
MVMNPRPPSPTLPGAWASAWSLRKIFKSQEGTSPKFSESAKLCSVVCDTENPPAAIPRSPGVGGSNSSNTYDDDKASLSASHDDDESITSDDFHSFTSDEVFNSEGEQNKEGETTLPETPQSKIFSSDISSTLHDSASREDVTLSDTVPSKVCSTSPTRPSTKLPDPALNDDLANSSSDSRLSEASSGTRPPSTVSRRTSSSSSCSDRSVAFRRIENEYDGESTYSNYSGLNYPRMCTLITRLGNGITSEQSLTASHPQNVSPVSPRQILRRRFENEYHDQRNNDFSLSQPDGNDPWTLSLEPTLTSAEPSISQTSTSSSSGTSNTSEDEDAPRRFFPAAYPSRSQSFFQQSSSNPSRVRATYDTEVSTTRRGSENSVYALSREEIYAPESASPPRPIGEDAPRPRNVVQKTKEFCSKFKKLLVPKKAPKPKDVKGLLHDYPLSDHIFSSNAPVQPIIPHLLPPSPREVSPWSFVRRRGMQREPKMSLPTMPNPEHRSQRIVQSSTTSVDKHSYEYHARPKTLEEIRSKRRFSLPVFSGPPAGQPSGSIGHSHLAYSYQRRPMASSIHSASQTTAS